MTMTKPPAKDQASDFFRLKQLQVELLRHNDLYYNQSSPEITDDQWDLLFRELQELESLYPEMATPHSPTGTVGAPVGSDSFVKVKHKSPMMSLDKALKPEEIQDFVVKTGRFLRQKTELKFHTMPKFDGLAIELVYQKGKLTQAATRGDGLTGEQVTAQILTIGDIPQQLPDKGTGDIFTLSWPEELTVRGEVYMEKEAFLRLNRDRAKEGQSLLSNPRNAAAGALRQLDPEVTRTRNLKFFAYGLDEPESCGCSTYGQTMEWLRSLSFKVEASPWTRTDLSPAEVLNVYEELEQARHELPYEIDGLVLTLEDLELWGRLGATSRAPRYALAVKFKPELAETLVRDIEIQVGRTGALTPVARLDPVAVGGVIVSNASLHNADELKRKDVRPGDTVLVRRAGEVIPEVVEVVTSKRPPDLPPFLFPETCPVCHKKALRLSGEAAWRCTNPWCPAQVRERFIHFASKKSLNIAGLGGNLVDLLLAEKLITIPTDLYRLTLDQLKLLPRLGEKSAQNLLNSLETSRTASLWRFIHALGIRNVGERTSQSLAENFNSINSLAQATEKSLKRIDDIGDEVVACMREFFQDPAQEKFLADLTGTELGLSPTIETHQDRSDRPLAGLKFVLTGTLRTMTRAEAKTRLMGLGAQIMSMVSQGTDYVVAGEAAGRKLARAETMRVKVLDEDKFAEMLSGREQEQKAKEAFSGESQVARETESWDCSPDMADTDASAARTSRKNSHL